MVGFLVIWIDLIEVVIVIVKEVIVSKICEFRLLKFL